MGAVVGDADLPGPLAGGCAATAGDACLGGHTADGYPGSKGWGSGPSGAPWGSGPSGTPAPGLNSGLLLPDNLVWSLGRECTGASHLRVPVPLLSGHGWFCAPYCPRRPTRVSSSSLPLGSSYLPSSPLLTSQKIFINHKADQVTPGLQSFPASTLPLRCIPDLPGHYHLLQPSLRTLPVTHTPATHLFASRPLLDRSRSPCRVSCSPSLLSSANLFANGGDSNVSLSLSCP